MGIATLFQNRRIKTGLILFCALLGGYLGFLTWTDRVHRSQDDVSLFWDMLDRVCKERLVLLPELATLIQLKVPEQHQLVVNMQAIYRHGIALKFPETTLDNAKALEQFVSLQHDAVNVLMNMLSLLPQDFMKDPYYEGLMQTLEERELQIQFAVNALNKKILTYNRLTQDLPQRWVNQVFTHFPMKYYPQVPTLEEVKRNPKNAG